MSIQSIKNIQRLSLLAFSSDQKALRQKDESLKNALFLKAERTYKNLIKLDKKNIEVILGLARVMLHQKKFNEALRLYKHGLNVCPPKKKIHIFNGLGNTYRYLGDYEASHRQFYAKAIHYYLKTIAKQPRTTLFWSNLSVAYGGLKEWRHAMSANAQARRLLAREKVPHGNLMKILRLEYQLYRQYQKRTLA